MTRYVRAPGVVARRVADEMVLVPVGTRSENPANRVADFFVLNETAEYLWGLLSSPRDEEELARHLIHEYEITSDRAHADVRALVDALQGYGALATVEAG
jgi:coenzyme PQQ synthesis protein D (PqqD)